MVVVDRGEPVGLKGNGTDGSALQPGQEVPAGQAVQAGQAVRTVQDLAPSGQALPDGAASHAADAFAHVRSVREPGTVAGIVGRSHSGIGRKTLVVCGAAAHPRVGVTAEPLRIRASAAAARVEAQGPPGTSQSASAVSSKKRTIRGRACFTELLWS